MTPTRPRSVPSVSASAASFPGLPHPPPPSGFSTRALAIFLTFAATPSLPSRTHLSHPRTADHDGRHLLSAPSIGILQKQALLAMDPVCTASPDENAIVTVDRRHDWSRIHQHRPAMCPLRLFLVKCLAAHHSESAPHIHMHALPWVFKGIERIFQPLLDPVVRDKTKVFPRLLGASTSCPPPSLARGTTSLRAIVVATGECHPPRSQPPSHSSPLPPPPSGSELATLSLLLFSLSLSRTVAPLS
ncbi:hypothetical protein V8E36_006390 [Tilletia maclaganii]